MCIYKIAHNGAIRPCHPSHSMPLALILLCVYVCVCVLIELLTTAQFGPIFHLVYKTPVGFLAFLCPPTPHPDRVPHFSSVGSDPPHNTVIFHLGFGFCRRGCWLPVAVTSSFTSSIPPLILLVLIQETDVLAKGNLHKDGTGKKYTTCCQ